VLLKIPEQGEGQSAVCSVPLLEMKIPSDVDFTMKVLTVPKVENPGEDQIKPPAAACGKSAAERAIVFPK
jgi:hypothetical protein